MPEKKKKKQVTILEPKHDTPYEGPIDDPVGEDKSAGFDFKLLYHPLSKYDVKVKINAVMSYMMTGDAKAAAKSVGVPHTTLLHWKNHSCWWDDTLGRCRLLKQDELDAGLTKVIEAGTKALEERIANGNPTKVGQVKTKNEETGVEITEYVMGKVQMPAKELATVVGITYDKRALSRGEATSRTDINGGGDGLASLGKLIQSFQQIGEDARKKRKVESIEADFTIVSPEALDKIKQSESV